LKPIIDLAARWFRLCLLTAGLSAPAAPLPSGWQREQPFAVSAAGLVKISLPGDTLESARPGLEDLRLWDEAGNETPYVIERPAPAPAAVQIAKSLRVSMTPDNTVITLETGLTQPLDGVTLETPANSFIKAVSVESSADGAAWTMIAQGQPLFRQPSGAGRLQIPLPAIAAQWLRLTVDDRRSQAVPFTGARVHAASGEAAPTEWMPVKISSRNENPGETRLALNLGAANLDAAAVQIRTTEPLFMRPISFAVPQIVNDSIQEQTVGQGVIFRVAVEGQTPSENLTVPLDRQIRSRELYLFIKNGDSAPLPVDEVRVERRPVYLIFLARQEGTFHLLTGNSRCEAPRYDLAALRINFKNVAPAPVEIPAPANNPEARAPEVLPGIELTSAALDVSPWRFRKPVKLSGEGVQQVELDLDVLAHAQANFADLRLMRGSNQVPFLIERTSISRALTPVVTATNEAKAPKVSRWQIQLPRAGLPLTRLACVARTPLFERSVSLYEEAVDERGAAYRRALGGASWQQTPDRKSKEFPLTLESAPQSATLYLETGNGDNPPVELAQFQVFYAATRVLCKGEAGGNVLLYYGNPRAQSPHYDLSLVAGQLLAAERHVASLSSEEQLGKSGRGENPAAGSGSLAFWGILAAVVAALLLIISRLLPKSPPA
jgi:hypothetical protein